MADAALLILYDNKKRLLLQLRDSHASKNPNRWGFFGGAISQGESPGEALKREISEELGYSVKKSNLILKESIPNDGIKYFFMEKFDDTQKIQLNEGKKFNWFPIDKISELSMPDHHRKALKKISEIIKIPTEL